MDFVQLTALSLKGLEGKQLFKPPTQTRGRPVQTKILELKLPSHFAKSRHLSRIGTGKNKDHNISHSPTAKLIGLGVTCLGCLGCLGTCY